MLTERLTFRAKYGHGDELVALFKESMQDMASQTGAKGARIYTDATGPMFTVALEVDHDDLAGFAASEAAQGTMFADPVWQQWFAKMMEITEGGERQLFNSEKLM